jgi:hypothetical protein
MKILNYALIVSLVLLPAIFLLRGVNIAAVGLLIFAILIALIFASLDKFKEFKLISKLFTLEAELRQTIDKAYAALDDLKELALALSEPMIADLTMSGQMMKEIHMEYKLESVEKITGVLRKLGASEQEVEQTCGFIYEKVRGVMAQHVLAEIRPENWEELNYYQGFQNWDFSEWDKARIESFAKTHSLEINDEAKEWLADIEYLSQTKKLRRPETWNERWQF